MHAEVEAAEQRLEQRMLAATARHAAAYRLRSFVFPILIVAAGGITSVLVHDYIADAPLPIIPIVAAAVAARTLGGVTAGRMAAFLAALTLCMAPLTPREGLWYLLPGNALTLAALCVDEYSLPRWIARIRRSAAPRDTAETGRHTPT
jgi:hypothetical protein